MVAMLLEAGYYLPLTTYYLLLTNCRHDAMVAMLLEAGADPTASDEHGKALLTMAREVHLYSSSSSSRSVYM